MILNIGAFWSRLRSNRRGNVLMLFGFAMIPMVFATGMGIDYSRAARLRTKLNAIADAAALAAVTQPMMLETDEEKVRETARVMFQGQANILGGLDGAPEFAIELSHPDGANSRAANVSYTAKSINAFGGILNMRTITIGGSSSAMASAPPNMDFYIALDTSSSMALPTTSAGFTTMDNAFSCAFACHSNQIEKYYNSSIKKGLIVDNSSFAVNKGNYGTSTVGGRSITKIDDKGSYIYTNSLVTDTISSTLKSGNGTSVRTLCRKSSTNNQNICIYNSDGTFVDSYWYALNKGVDLRVTAERSAIGDLMSLAKTYAQANKRTYRAALYTFDYVTNLKTIATLTNNLDSITTASSKIDVVQVNDRAANGCPPAPLSCSPGTYLFTSFKSILDKMDTELPAKSGHGTDAPGDTPQAFLFMVTDGMSDENIGSGRTRAPMQQAQVDLCNRIKASPRNVKIAILYTEYTVASIQDDEPNQRDIATRAITQSPTIAERLKQCASPDLMITVKTDESISAALQTLFTKAVASAHLIK